MAHFADVRGRRRVFTLSVFLMAIPTLLIGLLPTYGSIGIAAPLLLLAMRVMQGIAIGGEAPGAWVFVAEHARRGRVGLDVGLLTAGLSSGIFLGPIVAVYINSASLLARSLQESGVCHSCWAGFSDLLRCSCAGGWRRHQFSWKCAGARR